MQNKPFEDNFSPVSSYNLPLRHTRVKNFGIEQPLSRFLHTIRGNRQTDTGFFISPCWFGPYQATGNPVYFFYFTRLPQTIKGNRQTETGFFITKGKADIFSSPPQNP